MNGRPILLVALLSLAGCSALAALLTASAPLAIDAAQAVEQALLEARERWADEDEGDIYSVNGGVRHEAHLELYFARPWPRKRPHYE